MDNPRTLHLREGFLDSLRQFIPDPWEADQVLFGARWILMRDPHRGRQRPGSHVWTYLTRPPGRDTPFLIYYTFDDEHVVFLRITPQPL